MKSLRAAIERGENRFQYVVLYISGIFWYFLVFFNILSLFLSISLYLYIYICVYLFLDIYRWLFSSISSFISIIYACFLSLLLCVVREFNLQPGRYTSQSHDANRPKAGFLRVIPFVCRVSIREVASSFGYDIPV